MRKEVIFILVSVAWMSVIAPLSYAGDMGSCEPRDQLLTNPKPDALNSCLHFIWNSLGREEAIDKQFTNKLLLRLLPLSEEDVKGAEYLKSYDIDYSTIVGIIGLLKSDMLITRYLDFILFTQGSADESRSIGLGHLYTNEAPRFLALLSSYPREKQDIIIQSLAWGLANNFYPRLTKDNYRKMIIGVHWEILNKSYPYRSLAERVEQSVLKIL